MAQKEHVDVYTIPPNFAKEGTILSGRLEARNAVEAAVMAPSLLRLLMMAELSPKGKIYAGIIVILPVTILAVIGVQGEKKICTGAGYRRRKSMVWSGAGTGAQRKVIRSALPERSLGKAIP